MNQEGPGGEMRINGTSSTASLPHSAFSIHHSAFRLEEAAMCACERDAQLGPYHDGELSDAARREVEAHVAACPDCARELDRLRAISRRLEPLRETRLSHRQKSDLSSLHASADLTARDAAPHTTRTPHTGVAGRIGFGDGLGDGLGDGPCDSPASPPTAARTGGATGSPGSAVRWVKWLTAAAAAVFLFAIAQLFLADHISRPGGERRGTVEMPGGTTKPNEGIRPTGGAPAPVDAPLRRTQEGGSGTDAGTGSGLGGDGPNR
jgi:hypothetical protein